MKGPECIHIVLCVQRPDGAAGRHITTVTQYDADQQVRKVTAVLFTAVGGEHTGVNEPGSCGCALQDASD
jgi:hypothetical protein